MRGGVNAKEIERRKMEAIATIEGTEGTMTIYLEVCDKGAILWADEEPLCEGWRWADEADARKAVAEMYSPEAWGLVWL
jgi:hypothetical protein